MDLLLIYCMHMYCIPYTYLDILIYSDVKSSEAEYLRILKYDSCILYLLGNIGRVWKKQSLARVKRKEIEFLSSRKSCYGDEIVLGSSLY